MRYRPSGALTRRALLRLAGGGAGLLPILGRAPIAERAIAQNGAVEPLKLRRQGVGLRASDRERASPGYTLFAPLAGYTVLLIDMSGDMVHEWDVPYPPGQYGYLTERGTLLYNGAITGNGGVTMELDWDGRVLHEVRHPDQHHDGRLLSNGHVLLLCATTIPEEIAARVRGGRLVQGADDDVVADYLVEMTWEGEEVWRWRSWEHLDPAVDVITAIQDARTDWTHGNAIDELPNGDIVVSFRNISTVAIIERATGRIRWKLAAPMLAQQHAPAPLPNGNLLIFDNGTHRVDQSLSYSRVIEVDPEASAIVWSYEDRPQINFFSPLISNAQRLPNGNTLICEGMFGRLFEVTADGELVWEYVNPYFVELEQARSASVYTQAEVNYVFRAYRYTEAEIARARASVNLSG